MTDAESFYLILASFYFLECLKLRSPRTAALANSSGKANSWTPRSELVRFMGIKKWVYIAPLLPWPGLMIVVANERARNGSSKTVESPLRIKRLTDRYRKATLGLRVLSLCIFCYYFALLPYLYFLQRGTPSFFISVGIGYLLMFAAALLLFRVRARLLPRSKMSSIPQLLYTAFLPWHAMRCADDIFLEYCRHWSWPAILASQVESPQSRSQLQRLWREAQFSKRPIYSTDTLQSIFDSVKLKAKLDIHDPQDSERYCPCCLVSYQSSAHFCADCRNIQLVKHPQ